MKCRYLFLSIAKAYIIFLQNLVSQCAETCLNLYVRCYVVALHNFCIAALRKYHALKPKIEKLSIFTAKLAATLQKKCIFVFVLCESITFSHRIWFHNVQTTCLNLYVRYYVVALRNFCMAALREYPKNQKLKNY